MPDCYQAQCSFVSLSHEICSRKKLGLFYNATPWAFDKILPQYSSLKGGNHGHGNVLSSPKAAIHRHNTLGLSSVRCHQECQQKRKRCGDTLYLGCLYPNSQHVAIGLWTLGFVLSEADAGQSRKSIWNMPSNGIFRQIRRSAGRKGISRICSEK